MEQAVVLLTGNMFRASCRWRLPIRRSLVIRIFSWWKSKEVILAALEKKQAATKPKPPAVEDARKRYWQNCRVSSRVR